MFFRQMTDAFLVRTDPDSSMVKPAHIHITSAPQIKKRKRVENKTQFSSPLSVIAIIIADGALLSISRMLFSV